MTVMAETVIEMGVRLQAQQAADAAVRAQLDADLAADATVAALGTQIVSLLTAVLDRLGQLETKQAETQAMVVATRVRRPIRDELGSILYVVDELRPPEWAAPLSPAVGPAQLVGDY